MAYKYNQIRNKSSEYAWILMRTEERLSNFIRSFDNYAQLLMSDEYYIEKIQKLETHLRRLSRMNDRMWIKI